MHRNLLQFNRKLDLLPVLNIYRVHSFSLYSKEYWLNKKPLLQNQLSFCRNYYTFWDRPKYIKNLHENLFSLSLLTNGWKLLSCTPCVLDENNAHKDFEDEFQAIFDNEDEYEFEKWSKEILPVAGRHSVLVILPYIKWGTEKKRNTSTDLQLAEAVALVESLHGWKVVDKISIGLKSFEKKTVFGSGSFDALKQRVRKERRITAVFVSITMLRGVQHREIQNEFGVPVFDRYTLVIQLFRQHAVSREAKLQVAMAEIPYMWSRLRGMNEGVSDKRGIGGQTSYEIHKNTLVSRESKIKQALLKLRSHRQLLRTKRNKMEYPVIAVVGYTNSGKTSLIKALTGDETLQPENRLFATLDVSTHMGTLPCSMKVLYIDTIGFISDIPTNLLESFVATLEDAVLSDLILHVKDISHPDSKAQTENVHNTLHRLQLSPDVLENIIVVGNKQDLVKNDLANMSDIGIPVSAVTHSGIAELKKKIEEAVLRVTGRVSLLISAPQGGQEASWLYKEATVTDTKADPKNSQNLLMHVIITHAKLSKFQHYFIGNK